MHPLIRVFLALSLFTPLVAVGALEPVRLNGADLVDLGFLHAVPGGVKQMTYRVRAIDLVGRASEWSEPITMTLSGAGES
jgi:hypothetical protein